MPKIAYSLCTRLRYPIETRYSPRRLRENGVDQYHGEENKREERRQITMHTRRRGGPFTRVILLVAAVVLLQGTAIAAPRLPSDPERDLRLAVAETLGHNFHPRQLVIYPSPAYYNPYLRDSFWSAQALGNRAFSLYALDQFARSERADGEPPTYFINAYRYPRYHNDESASLVLVWAWRNWTLYHKVPALHLLQQAADYLLRHSRNGAIVTPPGSYASWWDAYTFPRASTLSYNQGLAAVAFECAVRLHVRLPRGTMSAAIQAYRALYDSKRGYLALSTVLPAADASALTGDFLSLWLFHIPLLPSRIVYGTVQHLSRSGAGFRVVALPGTAPADGSGLPESVTFGKPGDYQNGASWLLFDALSLGAAGLHGWPEARQAILARVSQEFAHGQVLHEYLQTNPQLPEYGSEPAWRDRFSWDSFALVILDSLKTHH